MFGGLHIELAALRSVGILLEDSGWTNAISEAGIVRNSGIIPHCFLDHQNEICTSGYSMRPAYPTPSPIIHPTLLHPV